MALAGPVAHQRECPLCNFSITMIAEKLLPGFCLTWQLTDVVALERGGERKRERKKKGRERERERKRERERERISKTSIKHKTN